MELIHVYYVAVFYLGAILGSFLNVVALDIQKLFKENDLENRNEFSFLLRHFTQKYFWQSLISRRSHCDSCGKVLSSFELFPIFSYLLQRGKCSVCFNKIDSSHFWVEILSGVYFLGIFYTMFWQYETFSMLFIGSALFWFVLFGTLFVLALFDYRTKLIPDILLFIAGIMSVIHIVMNHPAEWIWHVGAGALFAALFYGVWFFSGGRWIGFADGKLAIISGLLFGVSAGFTALAVSFWAGALFSIALLLLNIVRRKKTVSMQSAVPFGPFLVFGTWYVFVCGLNLFTMAW